MFEPQLLFTPTRALAPCAYAPLASRARSFPRLRASGLTWLLLLLSPLCLPGVEPTLALQRRDPGAVSAHANLLDKARKGGIDLYFFGDSITRRWAGDDYPEFQADFLRRFKGWKPGNFGVGGDTTRNMLWRLENGEIDGVHPKVIVLLAGTNDIGKEPGPKTATETFKGLQALVGLLRAKAPGATLILTGILPRGDSTLANPVIAEVNASLAALADGKSVRFLTFNDRLTDAQGRLLEGVTTDQLHLSLKGYQLWAEALTPLLQDLLGPQESATLPAKTAPLPGTGGQK